MASRSTRWVESRLAMAGAGEGVWIELRGWSMAPTLRDGDQLRVMPLATPPAPGEIVVARRGGRLVSHRLVSLRGGLATTRGDGCSSCDPPLPASALIGRVVEVQRRPDELAAAEVVARAARGELPSRFTVAVEGRALAPWHRDGDRVVVVRGEPRRGALACVADGDRIAWRRVLEVRPDAALLRAEVAPFDDGWSNAVIGTLEQSGTAARLAERLPGTWTRGAWAAAALGSRLSALGGRLRARLRGPLPFRTRVVDRGEQGVELQLVAPGGVLAGASRLDRTGYSFDTAVEERFRGRGGATLLLRAALAQARALGMTRLTAWVPARHGASLAAYARAGFRRTGRWWRSSEWPLAASARQLLEMEATICYHASR